jgi:nucleoside 2-deoxyribosyltransferase
MSADDPIRLFVTHGWDESDDYLRVFEFLESARGFFYRNLSTPEQRPGSDLEAARESLRAQIAKAEVVIALASQFVTQTEWLNFELGFARTSRKPVLLLRPFGSKGTLSRHLTEQATEVLDWDERKIVDAIRQQARGEGTNRWDTIEFKLD